MSRKLLAPLLSFVAIIGWSAETAVAQERLTTSLVDLAPATTSFTFNAPLLTPEQIQRALPPPTLSEFRRPGPSSLMTSLYASTAVMHALDVHSTLTAFKAGAVEGNPLMQGIAGNRAAFFGVKAGVAAGTILAARQLAKRNKAAAVLTLVAINSAYAMVVSHNYRVARSLQ